MTKTHLLWALIFGSAGWFGRPYIALYSQAAYHGMQAAKRRWRERSAEAAE